MYFRGRSATERGLATTRSIVIYDSWYGDTRRVAEEIARGIATTTGVDPAVVEVDHAGVASARELELIVLGSPNHFGGPTRKMRQLVRDLGAGGPIAGTIAVFDTCFREEAGKAAAKLAKLVESVPSAHARPPPQLSITVEGTRGPIPPGELVRAHEFGVALAQSLLRPLLAVPA